MASTITLNLDDRTDAQWQEFVDNLVGAKKATDATTESAKKLGDAVKAVDPSNFSDLEAKAKQASDSFDGMARSAKASGSAMSSAGKSGGVEFATSVTAAIQIFDKMGQIAGVVADKIEELSKRGNPALVDLAKQVDDTKSSWNDFLELMSHTDFGKQSIEQSTSILKQEADGLRALPELWENLTTIAHDYGDSVSDALNRVVGRENELSGAVQQQIRARQDARQAAIAQGSESAAAAERATIAEKALNAVLRIRKDSAQAAQDARLGNDAAVEQAIQKQVEAIRTQKMSAEELESALQRIQRLEQQRQKLAEDGSQVFQKDMEDNARASEELYKRRVDAEEKANETSRKEQEAATKAQEDFDRREAEHWQKLEDKKREELRRTAEEESRLREQRVSKMSDKFSGGMGLGDARAKEIEISQKTTQQIGELRQKATQAYVTGDVKGFFQARRQEYQILQQGLMEQKKLREQFSKEGNTLDKIKAGFSGKDIGKQVADDRFKSAGKEFVEKNKEGFGAFMKGKQGGELTDVEKKLSEKFQRDADKLQRDIQKQTQRDIKQGKIGQEEVGKATNELVNKTIDQAEKSGQFQQETVDALRQAAQTIQSNAEQTQQQSEELKGLSEQIAEVKSQLDESGGSSRQRAMRR